jgi:hypothetical protein
MRKHIDFGEMPKFKFISSKRTFSDLIVLEERGRSLASLRGG